MVKLLVQILSDPKFNTKHAAPVVALYTSAPLAVKDAGLQTALLNET